MDYKRPCQFSRIFHIIFNLVVTTLLPPELVLVSALYVDLVILPELSPG
jgi:hypothetical protein